MRDSSVRTTAFHSAADILLSSHHRRRRRLWFCIKGRPSNGRLEDRPLCCKLRRMIELLFWPTCSPDLSSNENVWSKHAQRLFLDTVPYPTPHQLWHFMSAA
ncbi:hypothetical protein TNCV_4893441 [Trichonephila clavipes]|nr:hypothetical protein TNCV_4893441 [Trichonephila clavipes]